jgi:hypothetical protein
MSQDAEKKQAQPTNNVPEDIADTKGQLDASAELRRTMMKRLAISSFMAPAVLVTLLKQPAAAS